MVPACSDPDPDPEPRSPDRALCERLAARSSCVPEGFSQCSDSAPPDHAFALEHDPLEGSNPTNRVSMTAEPPYGSDQCPGRHLYEVATADFVPTFPDPPQPAYSPMWIWTAWGSDIDTAERCEDITANVAIRRQLSNGVWEDWDAYGMVGAWVPEVGCQAVLCGGGKLPDGTFNEITGGPWSWIDVEDVLNVRVAVSAHDSQCEQQLMLMVAGETGT